MIIEVKVLSTEKNYISLFLYIDILFHQPIELKLKNVTYPPTWGREGDSVFYGVFFLIFPIFRQKCKKYTNF